MGIFGKTDAKPAETAPRPAVPSPPPPGPAAPPKPAAPAPTPGATSACVIGAKTQFKGEITGAETVLVEGLVEGTIRISGDLRVGRAGTVKANVSAQSVVVAGELMGDCHAAHRVEIEAAGRLTGNIRAPRVVIVEGATFRGNSDMSPRTDSR
jgi:cytoskeletal protein CcmA (bactofilin family)